ncbi:MAG: ATP-binding protein [Muribaculaceae bacterium]|nr:ATP-binding protein [Muribaculaceae bacterium]
MKIIERPIYLNRIIRQLNRGMMLVLVGQRRVGKSFMLKSISEWLSQKRPDANILFIDKDFSSFDFIKTADDLYSQAIEKLPAGKDNYLLIDEVQDIEGYEAALRSLYAEDRCQIIVTGSNAYMFSSEIATKFSGRYIEIPIRSLGYEEFLIFHDIPDSHESLLNYLRFGGMPGLANYHFDEVAEIKAYLQGVYNTVVLKDIVAREQIRNFKFLENLVYFIADNSGQLVSVNSIAKYLKSQGSKVTNDIISKYIKSICNALIVDSVSRYEIHGKRVFELIEKYYFSDHGIRNCIVNEMPNVFGSIEKILENVVRHHLLIQNFEVYVGVLPSGEIDFVAKKGEQVLYFQVAYKLSGTDTIRREFGNLQAIRDDYPKYVVTMEDITGPLKEYPGIHHIHLRDFLKMEF